MIDARLVKLVGDSAQTAIIVALVCEFIVVRKPGRKVKLRNSIYFGLR